MNIQRLENFSPLILSYDYEPSKASPLMNGPMHLLAVTDFLH